MLFFIIEYYKVSIGFDGPTAINGLMRVLENEGIVTP